MSHESDSSFDPRLIDLHLGQLPPRERAAVEAEVASSRELSEQHAMLSDAIAALASLKSAAASPELTERIVARVSTAARLRIVRPLSPVVAEVEGQRDFIVRFSNFRDIVAVAAMFVLAVGLGVPGMLQVRERNQRMGCSWNLAQVGRGLQAYATTYNASMPFAGWSDHASWQRSSAPGVEATPNRKHVYPLLKQKLVDDPRRFVCPSRMDVPMPREEVATRADFLESRNLSYAYYNMAGVRPTVNDDPNLVVLADDNPLFEDGSPLFRMIGTLASTNSRAHRKSGQNTLTLDGHVKWATTPNCGVGGDNIWSLANIERYTGREGPLSATDSHLLK